MQHKAGDIDRANNKPHISEVPSVMETPILASVFLVTHGDGSDGDEWQVDRIFATREAAEKYFAGANIGVRSNGSTYEMGLSIEEWAVEG